MPRKPLKPCKYPGCPKLTNENYCDIHKKLANRQYDKWMRNKEASSFYHSSEWRHKRENFLVEHPFCEECRKYGRLTKAVVVDHIIPLRQGGEPFDDGNLQSLCSSCHSSKSIKEGSRYHSGK